MSIDNRPAVLMLTPYLPYPPVSGGRMRTFELLKRLIAHYTITLVCFGRPEEQQFDLTPLRNLCETIVIDRASSPGTLRAAWLSVTTPRPITSRLYSSPPMRSTLADLLRTRSFALIHAESFYMLSNLPIDHKLPILLAEPAIEYVAWWRHAKVAQPIYQRPALAIEAAKMRISEPAVWRTVARLGGVVGVMSPVDQAIVTQAAPNVPTVLTPNGVDVQYFEPAAPNNPDQARKPDTALYMGDYKYFPNTDAVRYFVTHILPLIRVERPQFTLTLLGKDLPEDLRALGNDPQSGVIAAGLVDNTRPYLTGSAVFVCPLRSGSGTRFKLLEAMACGCPVVSTALGCEGLGAVDGDTMLIADSPRAFADAVLRVLNDAGLADRLGSQGRAWVVDQHSWDRSAALVQEAYTRLIKRSEHA